MQTKKGKIFRERADLISETFTITCDFYSRGISLLPYALQVLLVAVVELRSLKIIVPPLKGARVEVKERTGSSFSELIK